MQEMICGTQQHNLLLLPEPGAQGASLLWAVLTVACGRASCSVRWAGCRCSSGLAVVQLIYGEGGVWCACLAGCNVAAVWGA